MTDKSLGTFDEIPNEFQGDIIEEAFHLAKLANMSYEDRHTYELSLKYYRDFVNAMDTAKKDGIELGIEQTAIRMLQKNTDIDFIIEVTGLSKQTLETLKVQHIKS
jgi:hypothetical protein